jgi:hypothetical protein
MTNYALLQVRRMALATTALAAVMVISIPVDNPAQGASPTQTEPTSPRKNFLSAFEEFQKQIDTASKDVNSAAQILNDASKMTIDGKRADVSGLREKLLGLSKQLESDGSLAHAIDGFDSWIVAQKKRIDVRRGDLGDQQKVEGLLKRYDQFGNDVSRARELLDSYQKDIVRLLQDLTASEALASEYLLADEAGKARDALNAALNNVRVTIENFRNKLHDFGLNAPSS